MNEQRRRDALREDGLEDDEIEDILDRQSERDDYWRQDDEEKKLAHQVFKP